MTNKEVAFTKCKELATKYNGELEAIGEFGFGFEIDREKIGYLVDEYDLEVITLEEGSVECIAWFPEAGEEGMIFITQGFLQGDNRLLAGVAYNSL